MSRATSGRRRHMNHTVEGAPRLSNRTLANGGSRLRVPSYDRGALAPGIVHFGVGGFHRAHQAVYLDELAERGVTRDWGVAGVGLRTTRMKRALAPQDCLFTVVQRDRDGDAARVIGSMTDYSFAPDDPARVLRRLADPRTRLVTLTVTGDAYEVDPDDADVAHDIRSPQDPRTLFGYLVEGLRLRRDAGTAPFTVLSCDNVPGNGAATRSAVVSLARLRDDRLADWIEEAAAFPSSVVDRITPAAGVAARRLVADEFGVDDRSPVVTERFAQWIIEDSFSHGRPPLEEVGVEFVPDVAAHELVKKRLLNGTHCALGYLGRLSGYSRTDEAMADESLRAYAA